MYCYTLNQSAVLDPFIATVRDLSNPDSSRWCIQLGNRPDVEPNAVWPVGKILDARFGNFAENVMQVTCLALPAGTYLLKVENQTPLGGWSTIKLSHPISELGRGTKHQSFNGRENLGVELLVAMLPGDWVEITSGVEAGGTPNRYYVYASVSVLEMLGPRDWKERLRPV